MSAKWFYQPAHGFIFEVIIQSQLSFHKIKHKCALSVKSAKCENVMSSGQINAVKPVIFTSTHPCLIASDG